jgi:precorrin-6Y C5,15-methyltransferase (decarboxylating)
MRIDVVGIGMGNPDTMTLGALRAVREAELLIGAKRMLASLPADARGEKIDAVSPDEILAILAAHPEKKTAAVVLSGDVGFYSGAAKLLPRLPEDTRVFCGVTTVQYLAALLRKPWQNAALYSAHGTDCDVVGSALSARESFFLTGGKITPQSLLKELSDAGLGDCEAAVGENLSYPDERVTCGTAAELCEQTFRPLSAVWVTRKELLRRALGIPDDEFIRGEVPMTKQEVRAAVLAKLGARPGETVYDVGAGTGSVSVELALLSPFTKVYAVECVPEACDLIRQNREKFGAYNLRVVEGSAPGALNGLPAPDRAFVGGSRGNLREILACLKEKNPGVRVTVSAIAAETLAGAMQAMKELGFTDPEVAQIAVSRTRKVGPYHMLTAQNPIFLITADGEGRA